MSIIKKKIWPDDFKLVNSGKKKFEWRVADFKIKTGDKMVLEEWNPKTKKYTGKKSIKKVSFVRKLKLNEYGQEKLIEKKGFYIIQF